MDLNASMSAMELNFYVLAVFAPVLVLVGILGFVIPENKSLTSGAPAYNVFHIAFGLLGLGCLLQGESTLIRAFNIGFGLIDLYQAAASFLGWFPRKQFRWKRADDILHIVVGFGLVLAGLLGG